MIEHTPLDPLASRHPVLRRISMWAQLFALSALLVFALDVLGLAAAPLLGAMLAAILLSLRESGIRMYPALFPYAQSILGFMIARSFTLPALMVTLENWPLTLVSVVSVTLCSFALGWIMAVRNVLPGNTALWGSWPGAAFAMCVMAEEYGADTRLVAVMQYTRVILVVILASTVTHFFVAPHDATPSTVSTLLHSPPLFDVIPTLFLTLACAFIGRISRIPAGSMLLSMIVATMLQNSGLFQPMLPSWLLLSSYAILGWTIGLRFTRPIIIYALHTLPSILMSILILVILCCGIAALMVMFAGVDPLTAYLAASPGGADSIAIIAASSQVDMPFVMSVQMARFALILFVGPVAARYASAKMEQRRARFLARQKP